jgi:endonuclease/exonuclease/phosphatase family metal-dependent hydrolase
MANERLWSARSGAGRRRAGRAPAAGGLPALAAVLLLLAATGCGGSGSGTAPTPSPKVTSMQLRVMEFNIEYGGDQISFDQVVTAAKAAGADVIGLEEAETNSRRLAEALGWKYVNDGMQVISKYPILEPSGSDGVYAFIEVEPGRVVAISNVHLPSDPYGPYWVADGRSAEQVLALERRVRLPALQRQLAELPRLAADGIPVFMTGDFNSPSHLDWTAAAVGHRPQIKYALEWPVSAAVAAAGFRDSWRETHPDPVAHPGLTWWAARPTVPDDWNPPLTDPQDRIDFVYAAGPSQTVGSEIVGEDAADGAAGLEVGAPRLAAVQPALGDVGIALAPWPSDHRGVVSTFELTPAPMPDLVAVDAWLVPVGETIVARYHAPAAGAKRLTLAPAAGETPAPDATAMGGASSPPTASSAATPVTATGVEPARSQTIPDGTSDGVVRFATDGLEPGAYTIVLANGERALAEASVWLQTPGARPSLTTDRPSYAVGQPVVVAWQDAPANRWDWLGVYKAPADPQVDSYLIWQYTGGASAGTLHGKPAGSMALEGTTTEGDPWPLPPGRYQVFYLLADGYDAVAEATFTVSE